jgi:hypothetical protein
VLESIRVLGNMGFFVVYSDAAQKIQVEIWLAFRLAPARTVDFLCCPVFANAVKHICLPANSHEAVCGDYRVVRLLKTDKGG